MALLESFVKRLPLSTAMLYGIIGLILGVSFLEFIKLDPFVDSELLERITEIAVLVSVFSTGLKLRLPLNDKQWWLPLRLVGGSMLITISLVTLVGVLWLELPLGAAILLGAILAPTDPVLASDVQLENPLDQDHLRFTLTGEGGLNDGTAFPFVMLGLGLLGLHELGDFGWRWVAVDVIWAIGGGLAIGWLLGTGLSKLVLYLRKEHKEAVGRDDFLALGLIGLSYGLAVLLTTYGFLAVFAAGLALRRIERIQSDNEAVEDDILEVASQGKMEEVATHPQKASAYMTQAVLKFNEQIERAAEIVIVLIVGAMLSPQYLRWEILWFVPLLFLIIRPLSVWISLIGSKQPKIRRWLISWFGVRGIGSIYYLTYAIEHGLGRREADPLISITLTVVATSIVVHGISVTPLMQLYQKVTDHPRNPQLQTEE